jgi:hypothetical protein
MSVGENKMGMKAEAVQEQAAASHSRADMRNVIATFGPNSSRAFDITQQAFT